MNGQGQYTLDVRVSIRGQYAGQGLEIAESLQVEAADFLAMAKILGQFHDLVRSLNRTEIT